MSLSPELPIPPRQPVGSGWRGRSGLLIFLLWSLVAGCHSLRILSQDKPQAKKQPEPDVNAVALPTKYSFRIAPYVFVSDFEIKKEQPLFQELGKLRDEVSQELSLPYSQMPVQVYLFEDKERYERFIQEQYPQLPPRRAFFVAPQRRSLGGGEELLVYTYWGKHTRKDLRHELTHALLHGVLRDVPLWLDEGLAEFFELPPHQDGINTNHLEELRRDLAGSHQLDLKRLEGLREVDEMKRPEYRESWAWVYLMLRTRPRAKEILVDYLKELRGKRTPGSLREKLLEVFPSPEEALERNLSRLDARVSNR